MYGCTVKLPSEIVFHIIIYRQQQGCTLYNSTFRRAGEPEPLEKKPGAGAGAAKKLAGSSALREYKKYKVIVLSLLFFR